MQVVAGIGLIVAGMRLAGHTAAAAGRPRLRRALTALADRPLAAALAGVAATALVHSSSASTIAIVGLVDGGLLPLPAAAAAIIGANVGTTLPVQLLAWRPSPATWLLLLATGAVLALAGRRLRPAGGALAAFACLLGGLSLIDRALAPLAGRPWFRTVLLAVAAHPWLGLAAGAALATAVLSSSLTIGVLQGLASQGLLAPGSAAAIVFGCNVGTTTDALLASLATGRAGRRAALFHLLFNLAGAGLFMALRGPLIALLGASGLPAAGQVGMLHLLFNLGNAAWLFPLRGVLLRITGLVLPPRGSGPAG